MGSTCLLLFPVALTLDQTTPDLGVAVAGFWRVWAVCVPGALWVCLCDGQVLGLVVTAVSSSYRISLARWPTFWKRSRSKWLSPQRGWCAPPYLTSVFLPACSCGCNPRSRRNCMSLCGLPSWLLASSPTAWWGSLLVRRNTTVLGDGEWKWARVVVYMDLSLLSPQGFMLVSSFF